MSTVSPGAIEVNAGISASAVVDFVDIKIENYVAKCKFSFHGGSYPIEIWFEKRLHFNGRKSAVAWE